MAADNSCFNSASSCSEVTIIWEPVSGGNSDRGLATRFSDNHQHLSLIETAWRDLSSLTWSGICKDIGTYVVGAPTWMVSMTEHV